MSTIVRRILLRTAQPICKTFIRESNYCFPGIPTTRVSNANRELTTISGNIGRISQSGILMKNCLVF